jgi:hypothetical protein
VITYDGARPYFAARSDSTVVSDKHGPKQLCGKGNAAVIADSDGIIGCCACKSAKQVAMIVLEKDFRRT